MQRLTLQLRLPPDIKCWLKAQAATNGSSQNSEVLRSIRERMRRDQDESASRVSPSNAAES